MQLVRHRVRSRRILRRQAKSMLIASTDRSDPYKNVIYRIAPDGTFMGAFATLHRRCQSSAPKFTSKSLRRPRPARPSSSPSSEVSSPAAAPVSSTIGGDHLLRLSSSTPINTEPGQNVTSRPCRSASRRPLSPKARRPALVSANIDYVSPVYSTFTDFGNLRPPVAASRSRPGSVGVQGLNGEFLINGGIFPLSTDVTAGVGRPTPAISTNFRRFEDAALRLLRLLRAGPDPRRRDATTERTTGRARPAARLGGTGLAARPERPAGERLTNGWGLAISGA